MDRNIEYKGGFIDIENDIEENKLYIVNKQGKEIAQEKYETEEQRTAYIGHLKSIIILEDLLRFFEHNGYIKYHSVRASILLKKIEPDSDLTEFKALKKIERNKKYIKIAEYHCILAE